MVARTLFAFDSDNMVDQTSGNGIINNSDTPNGRIFTYSSGIGKVITIDDTRRTSTFDDDNRFRHTVTDGNGLVTNGTSVEAESLIEIRALDAAGNPTGDVITPKVFSQDGVTSRVWGFSSDTPLVDGVSYIKVGGPTLVPRLTQSSSHALTR